MTQIRGSEYAKAREVGMTTTAPSPSTTFVSDSESGAGFNHEPSPMIIGPTTEDKAMDLLMYRFDGLNLEQGRGALVAGGEMRRELDGLVIRTALREPDQFQPTFAIVFVDIVLDRGEFARIQAERGWVDEMYQNAPGTDAFQRMLLIAPGTEVTIGNRRRGGVIVTRLRNADGALRIVSQDKPAGC
jgi:hypothetical protein